MEDAKKTDATDIEPGDATPSDDVNAPEPAEPDPGRVVEENGEQS